MTSRTEFVASMLSDAATPGPEICPTELLEIVAQQPDPIASVGDTDTCLEIWTVLEKRFESIRYLTLASASERIDLKDKREQWIGVLRWMLRELQHWRLQDDPRHHRLVTLFVISCTCDEEGGFWRACPADIGSNQELLLALKRILAGSSCDLKSREAGPVSISGSEFLDKLTAADEQGNWVAIDELWPPLEQSAAAYNIFVSQAVKCLYRFGFDDLVEAVKSIKQFALAMKVVDCLGTGERLYLACTSDNTYIQFAGVYETFIHKPRATTLDAGSQASLERLLLTVMRDSPRWVAWMQVYNRYPVRYLVMQPVLGRALAIGPDSSLKPYIDALNLNTSQGTCRTPAAECLRSFHASAPLDRRQTLWRLAYERWSSWDFGVENRSIMQTAYSELDYALVGYAIECLNAADRADTLKRLEGQICAPHHRWHVSFVDCLGAWYRSLSLYQIFAHADGSIASNQDWLRQGAEYRPTNLQASPYLKLMYHIA